MNNVPASKTDQENLKLYLRLILSYSDFKHAYRCALYLRDQHDIYEKEGGDDLLLRALYSSLVVAYARPFNSYGSSRYGRVPALGTEIHEVLSADDLKVHDYILHCRNKLIAHTDAEAVDVTPFIATNLPDEMVIPSQLDAMAPFTKEFTEVVLVLAEKCWHWCVEKRLFLDPLVKHLLERREFR